MSHVLCKALDNHAQVDVVYMDFSKTFDRIDNVLLLNKLGSFKLSNGLITLIKSNLDNRFLCVMFNGCESKPIF